MSAVARLAVVGLVRAPGRTAVRVLTLAAAVALLGAMLLFVGHSLHTMTASAVRSVPLAWQGPVGSEGAAKRVAAAVATKPGVSAAMPVATAPFAGFEHRSSSMGTIRTGSGSILAVPARYSSGFHTFRFLRGSLQPDAVVLDQQLAATLQAQPGDTVLLVPRRGEQPSPFRVSGIAVVTAPDVLFQPLNPLTGPAPAQPPANVAVLPLDTFARAIAPSLPSGTATTLNAAVPGAQTGVQWQVQAQVDPHALGVSPASALKRAGQIRNGVERSLPGQVQFVDNLSESLTTATADALYAEALFIMLAIPGAFVALGLAYLAALGTVERDRRDLSLLRARGSSRRGLVGLAAVESAALGVLAGAFGTIAALVAVHLTGSGGGIGPARAFATFAICTALALMGAFVARLGSGLNALRDTVTEGRRTARRETKPLWQRLYLDFFALAVSGLVYWLTARTGFSAVVNPDSNPTLSLSVYMFLAPALLWIGATLLLVRLRGRLLARLAARAAGNRASSWRGFLLASAARRGSAINRGLIVVGLLLAFGVNLGVFTATYDQQARVDAQLTLGADVVVSAPPGVTAKRRLAERIASVPGAAGVTAVDHSYAYVGPDLQDTFGIDATNFTRASSLRDSYFLGGSAKEMLARLQARPDGILVSRETVVDYSLGLGDLLKLRVLDRASGHFRVVPFHVVGVVQEFPSAPRDSFMVTNLTYLERATHDPGPNLVFVKAKGDPIALGRRIADTTRTDGTIVRDIRHQTAQTVSSITTVSLGGISRIEEAFAVLLAAAAMGLFVSVGLAERRQEFATMAALGASLRQVASFLWSEAALVLATAIPLAALVGWLLTVMLVAMLRHVFDPPPDHLALPWQFLAALFGATVIGTLGAAALAGLGIRKLPLGAILREE